MWKGYKEGVRGRNDGSVVVGAGEVDGGWESGGEGVNELGGGREGGEELGRKPGNVTERWHATGGRQPTALRLE